MDKLPGLDYKGTYDVYVKLFTVLRKFAGATYFPPADSTRFKQSPRLDEMRVRLMDWARAWGIRSFFTRIWDDVKDFVVSEAGDPSKPDPWHHGEDGEEKRFVGY